MADQWLISGVYPAHTGRTGRKEATAQGASGTDDVVWPHGLTDASPGQSDGDERCDL